MWSSDRDVEDSTEHRKEQDHKHPSNFVVALGWFIAKAVHKNSYPEEQCDHDQHNEHSAMVGRSR